MRCKDRKVLSKFISAILIIVFVFHLLWYINYSKFPKASGYELGVNNYYKEFEEYIISYHPPQYPRFIGNYAISDYEEDFQVTVSIDGNPYLHNYLRPYKNGNPSFDDVDKAINLLQKYNVNIGILEITYTKFHENNNISKKDLEDYFKNRYGDISLYITNCSGDNIYAIDVNKFVENDIIYDKNVKLSVLRKLLGKGNYKICCDAGSGSFAISPTGTIIPCHFFMGHNEYLMGQLPKTNLANKETLDINYIFRNTDKRISDDCSDCWIRDLCAECPASILIQNKEKINESCSIKRIKREKIIRDFIRNGDIY